MKKSPEKIQRAYYQSTAESYDSWHVSLKDEHNLALHYLEGFINFYEFKSILDIGAGTGRVALFLKKKFPNLNIVSIEPVPELREIGKSKGLSSTDLRDGNIYKLEFPDSSFDLVCSFGVFHHLENPIAALKEMQRVSTFSLFISDTNNYGQGDRKLRFTKQILRTLRVWKFIVFVKNGGKKYSISEGDGLYYSFSIFDLLKHLRKESHIYLLGTVPSQNNLFKSASHLALFTLKK